MKRFAESIVKYRWAVIATVLALTMFFGYQLKNIHINSDIISSLPDDDPAAKLYKEIGTQFGGNDMGIVVLESQNVFSTQVLEHVNQVTDSIKYTNGVSTVTSLINVLDIKSNEEGIEIGKLIDENNLPKEESVLDSLRNYIYSKEMYKGAIVSDDGTSTAIIFTLLPEANKQQVAKDIKNKIEKLNLPETLYFGGLPMMMNDINDLIIADLMWLIPIVFVVIMLVLFISFRSISGVVIPLLVAGLSVIWTLGLLSFLGYEITIISNIIPVVLLAVGSAYAIHVINSINHTINDDPKHALIKALTYVIIPVILAAVTTSIGFVSFVFGSYLTMIKDFGIFTAIGVLFALLLSVFFVPAIIYLFSGTNENKSQTKNNSDNIITNKILMPLIEFLFKHPKYIFSAWVLIILLSVGGMFMIKTSVNMADYFKKDNPTRVSEDIMQKKFGGSLPIFVVFEGDIQSPEVLKKMIKTQHFMKEDPNVSVTQSVADLIEQMNDAMGEGKIIPDEKAKIEQLWFLLDGQDVMPQLVNNDLTKGIIQSKFANVESDKIQEFNNKMLKYIEQNSSDDCKITLTGMPSVYVRLNNSLINSQFSSLILAILMVLLIVGLIFKSLSQGIYATTSVISTVLVLFGFMGFAGIPLDIATVLVGSIALGIGIDYSIHIISGFNEHLKETGNAELAIQETILRSGRAVIINILSVSAGFLVLIFSQIVPLQNFGILVAISMIGSGFGALTLLPLILILANRKSKLTLKNNH